MKCAATDRWIAKRPIGLALVFCLWTLAAHAQDRNGSVPPRPRYVGPPASIDGPEPIPAPSVQSIQPGDTVILPDGADQEPLALPGGSIEDALPPDWLIAEPPPQKLSAY